MHRCHRCSVIYITSPFDHFCADCGERFNRLIAAVHDERSVLNYMQVASMALHGEAQQMQPRWTVK